MKSLMEWMNGPWEGEHAVPGVTAPTILQVYASFLVRDTGGYGFLAGGMGLYRHEGLEMREAHVWWQLRAFVDGWTAATEGAESKAFNDAIQAEHLRVATLLGTMDEYNRGYGINTDKQDNANEAAHKNEETNR